MPPERRGALAVVLKVCGAALALAYTIPAALYLGKTRRDADEELDLGSLASIPEHVPTRIALTGTRLDAWSQTHAASGAVFVVRERQSVRVLDAACPHTGCSVEWRSDDRCFRCPCHRSAFAVDGARLGGPAPRGLDPQEVVVRDGRLWLRYHRYRAGRADRTRA